MDGAKDSRAALYRTLVDRLKSLEASHRKLQEQFTVLLQEKSSNIGNVGDTGVTSDSDYVTSFPGWECLPGTYFSGIVYRRILECMGHAVHVTRTGSGEIIYWNTAAGKLYGYKDYEVIGTRDVELLFHEEHHRLAFSITESVKNGKSWSGQLPLKKRSGQIFMALVTKSPFYDNGEHVGIVTVSSDAAVFNKTNSRNMRESKVGFRNLKKIQWQPQPQLTSSVSTTLVVKVFSRLQIGPIGNLENVVDEKIPHNGYDDSSTSNDIVYEKCDSRDSIESHDSGASSSSGQGSSSSKGENDSNVFVDCEIQWEDLQLRDEIGQGSFAVVYRGIWNGSDVSVKVYSGNLYNEDTLIDYKKEIDIMRRLRHPNVLLFMGAVCSHEKLGIVTEYLIRGSLFKTLHKNNKSLDIRRRLKYVTGRHFLYKLLDEAGEKARGVNYLHHRNPPIVHRDLKSSNLIVDKSWTVKVGDFGLSKLKHATFLTAKSGRGTPQWMAPEVLRNEPSTEKSDVFSFGVILWELMTECVPWSNLNPLQVVGFVGFMDRRLDIPKNMNPRVSSIIFDCWLSNPENHPSFEDIICKMTDLVHSSSTGVK